ncbi:MAG: NAD-dependent epimerase/dehydratase family protein [Bacteroidota bacterium]
MSTEKVAIFGGTGFIGLSLAKHLADRGLQPILVARNRPKKELPYEFVQWDAHTLGSWAECLSGAKAVVNLAGNSVDCIKTPDNCDVILRSRVESTKVIGLAISSLERDKRPSV